MIVWIASYPRSGNTFFRILVHRMYGVPTYSGALFRSGDDIRRDTGRNLTGEQELPAGLGEAMRARDEARAAELLTAMDAEATVYFIKTHAARVPDVGRVVLLVRDGRDAAISLAWYMLDVSATFRRLAGAAKGRPYLTRPHVAIPRMAGLLGRVLLARASGVLGLRERLWRRVLRDDVIESEELSWSRFHEAWLARRGALTLVRYEDLVCDPAAWVASALRTLDVGLEPGAAAVPTFEELKAVHPAFFRAGRSTWREEMPPEDLAIFRRRHGACLARFGYEA